ncbi:ASPIC/UnbV [Candidatus Koribacter versatilis Ellin345]|uniref:ASPIC/UnbV n=1 Tax=Koribacter versatilis (strain Ellin345) TaxID=204669 RepID=Q1IT78_KORVE|nr:CRTAC1 family protein [Candidatus Koribacter versatilis]ABF39922.1 ASPIC/UnbV [Candidatus Koribacter versatilis Ellin345]
MRIRVLRPFLASATFLTLCLALSPSSPVEAAQTQSTAAPAAPLKVNFVDIAEKAGLTVDNVYGGVDSKKYIIETTGSGIAVIDYDKDGWPDLFFVNGTTLDGAKGKDLSNRLYHNNHDGTFTDVTKKANLWHAGWGQGACVGDYDNDGNDDLFVTYYGKNILYHNNGNGTFTDVSEKAGVAGSGKMWGTGCAFVDYDRDGKLDLFVANYVDFDLSTAPAPGERPTCIWKGAPVMCGPRGLPWTKNLLYHNKGDGTFEDVTDKARIDKTNGHYSFSVSVVDYDDDGWPDIFVACDSTPAILYHNNHDGTFTDVAVTLGAAFNEDGREQAGMGSTVADYDGDGRLDIFKTNFSDDTSTLLHNDGPPGFTDATTAAGLGLQTKYLGWGTMFFDIDNDGWPDLILANGHVYPEVDKFKLGSDYAEPRLLYRNYGDGKFTDLSTTSGPGISAPHASRGVAVADLWNDGRQSVIISNMNERPLLLVNEVKYSNHWIAFKAIGTKSNRSGIGAKIQVTAGKRVFVNEVRSGSSYNSSSDLRVHFGLGTATSVDTVEVRWPSGETERFTAKVDQVNTLKEGSGEKVAAAKK